MCSGTEVGIQINDFKRKKQESTLSIKKKVRFKKTIERKHDLYQEKKDRKHYLNHEKREKTRSRQRNMYNVCILRQVNKFPDIFYNLSKNILFH